MFSPVSVGLLVYLTEALTKKNPLHFGVNLVKEPDPGNYFINFFNISRKEIYFHGCMNSTEWSLTACSYK